MQQMVSVGALMIDTATDAVWLNDYVCLKLQILLTTNHTTNT